MRKVIFVMGLQGVGKSRWIQENHPEAFVVDIEYWWQNHLPTMDKYELATWTKMMAQSLLISLLNSECELIAVEISGMTKVNQSAVHAMIVECRLHHYEIELFYLKPANMSVFIETLEDNPGALQMLHDYSAGGDKWREPSQCPYFAAGNRIIVDHSSWTMPGTTASFTVERTD